MLDWRKIIRPAKSTDHMLGCPAGNMDFRLNHFSEMTGGKGFRSHPKASNGDRVERKAAARAAMLENFQRPQPPKYLNSHELRSIQRLFEGRPGS